MAKPKGTHFVISASSTATGAPVYLKEGGAWSDRLQDAACWASEAERDAALIPAAAREDLVCDAYSFMVLIKEGAIDPMSARESIRAQGPTVRVRRPDSAESPTAGREN
jgi:hypothetical protein